MLIRSSTTQFEGMLKIKLKYTNLLDFVSSSSCCLENEKLSWNSYWHKNSSYKCIHISALQSRKLRQIELPRLTLSSVHNFEDILIHFSSVSSVTLSMKMLAEMTLMLPLLWFKMYEKRSYDNAFSMWKASGGHFCSQKASFRGSNIGSVT